MTPQEWADVARRLEAVERRQDRIEKVTLSGGAYGHLTLEEAYAEHVVPLKPETLRKWWRDPARRVVEQLEVLVIPIGRHLFVTRARAEEWQRAKVAALFPDEQFLKEVADEVAETVSPRAGTHRDGLGRVQARSIAKKSGSMTRRGADSPAPVRQEASR